MVLRQQRPRKKPCSPISPQILLLVENSHVSIPFFFNLDIIKTQAGPAVMWYALGRQCFSASRLESSPPQLHSVSFLFLFGVLKRTDPITRDNDTGTIRLRNVQRTREFVPKGLTQDQPYARPCLERWQEGDARQGL